MAYPLLDETQSQLIAALPPDHPVVMLNLLRFRPAATYDQAMAPCTGREAYGRYAEAAMPAVQAVGARLVFAGRAAPALIGADGEHWDQVFLVRYPSPAAFLALLARPDYQAVVHHRRAALADSRLIPLGEYAA